MGVLGHFSQLPDLVPTQGPGLSIWVPVISFTILASKQTNILPVLFVCTLPSVYVNSRTVTTRDHIERYTI